MVWKACPCRRRTASAAVNVVGPPRKLQLYISTFTEQFPILVATSDDVGALKRQIQSVRELSGFLQLTREGSATQLLDRQLLSQMDLQDGDVLVCTVSSRMLLQVTRQRSEGSLNWKLARRIASSLLGRSSAILILGLDNAGKSVLAQILEFGRVSACCPCPHIHPYEVQASIQGSNFLLAVYPCPRPFAGSGLHVSQLARPLHELLGEFAGVVFVVDASDQDRLSEAVEYFEHIFLASGQVMITPLLVVLNKADRPSAMTTEHVVNVLGFDERSVDVVRGSCYLSATNLVEDVLWLHLA